MSGRSRRDIGRFWLSCWLSVLWPAVNFASEPASAMEAGPQTIRPTLDAEDLHVFVDSFVAKQLASSGIPGAVVVVVKDGRVILAGGYGVADVESHRQMTADQSLMNIAPMRFQKWIHAWKRTFHRIDSLEICRFRPYTILSFAPRNCRIPWQNAGRSSGLRLLTK